MVNPPVIAAPVSRGSLSRSAGVTGAAQSYVGAGIPSEGADLA